MTWRCPHCESVWETNDPPCSSCGHESLVPAGTSSAVGDDTELETGTEPKPNTDDTATLVWACPECDREHVKNSPPCSRCGNPLLERRERTFDDVDDDLPAGSYLSAIKPYTPLIVLFALVIGLTASGTISVGMLPGHGPPHLPDAPGDSDVSSGINLETVEREIYERLEDERERRDVAGRTRSSELDHLATYFNRDRVRTAHGLESDDDSETIDWELSCSRTPVVYPITLRDGATIDVYADETEAAETVVEHLRTQSRVEGIVFSSHSAEGIDVHVGEDDSVYVYYAVC